MCVKKHIHFAISPAEQLKYWLIGLPLVLIIAYVLSIPVQIFVNDMHDTMHEQSVKH